MRRMNAGSKRYMSLRTFRRIRLVFLWWLLKLNILELNFLKVNSLGLLDGGDTIIPSVID
jgi:hypothetical protein